LFFVYFVVAAVFSMNTEIYRRAVNMRLRSVASVALLSATLLCSTAAARSDALQSNLSPQKVGSALQRTFVWLASAPTGQQAYIVFRKEFNLATQPTGATLHLFADSRYMLWINGQYAERGPCRFDPVATEYDTLDVGRYLQQGTNAMALLVHHYHDGKSSTDWVSLNGRIMRHAPGLTARLDLLYADGRSEFIRSDETWRGSPNTRFLASSTGRWEDSWSSIPDRMDARRDSGDWTRPAFDDSAWEKPVAVDGGLWGGLRPRGIPRLRETQVGPLTLLEHSRSAPSSPRAQASADAAQSLDAVLPIELQAGEQLIIDAGQFV
jgi:alpha-L-rhamnosidase